jgi:hypothetical protein
MSKQKFTTEADLLWAGIPVAVQKRILKNAFCAVEGIFNPAGPGLLTAVPRRGNGTFQFGFTNYEGMTQTILTTTNLALPLNQWTILGTAVETPAGSGHYQFNDPQTANYLQRYYRATSP